MIGLASALLLFAPLSNAASSDDILNRMKAGDGNATYEYLNSTGTEFAALTKACLDGADVGAKAKILCLTTTVDRGVAGNYADILIGNFAQQPLEVKSAYLAAIIGFSKDTRAQSLLDLGLADAQPAVRKAAARLFFTANSTAAMGRIKPLERDSDARVAATVRSVLAEAGDTSVCPRVRTDLGTRNRSLRKLAFEAMAFCGGAPDLVSLDRVVADSNDDIGVRDNALRATWWIRMRSAATAEDRLAYLRSLLSDPNIEVGREWAAKRLKEAASNGDGRALDILTAVSVDAKNPGRQAAQHAVNRLK
jgi:hypothetical protein